MTDKDFTADAAPKARLDRRRWPLLWVAPAAMAAGWIAYSALRVNHRRRLPPALPGEMLALHTSAGRLNVYADVGREGVPLLLIHSINAAASAYEVRPLYLHYRSERPVYALDLPGFGFSQRDKKTYTARLMADAIHAAVGAIRQRHGIRRVDVISLSLSCEYAARAALERPEDYRSLGFVSPTGFDRVLSGDGPDQSDRGSKLALSAVSIPLWSQAAYDLLVSGPSMRFFLCKTWGSLDIDEGLFAYDQMTAHQPGARHAVWSFLAGYLFAGDVSRLYRRLTLPVWSVHGVRGDFVDYRHEQEVAGQPNWTFDVFETGAFPHFERLDEVVRSYDAFVATLSEVSERADARLPSGAR